ASAAPSNRSRGRCASRSGRATRRKRKPDPQGRDPGNRRTTMANDLAGLQTVIKEANDLMAADKALWENPAIREAFQRYFTHLHNRAVANSVRSTAPRAPRGRRPRGARPRSASAAREITN